MLSLFNNDFKFIKYCQDDRDSAPELIMLLWYSQYKEFTYLRPGNWCGY